MGPVTGDARKSVALVGSDGDIGGTKRKTGTKTTTTASCEERGGEGCDTAAGHTVHLVRDYYHDGTAK